MQVNVSAQSGAGKIMLGVFDNTASVIVATMLLEKWLMRAIATSATIAAVLGGNALPIQKVDLIEGPSRFIEEQHEPQAVGQIGLAGKIYSRIWHGRFAHATYEAEA